MDRQQKLNSILMVLFMAIFNIVGFIVYFTNLNVVFVNVLFILTILGISIINNKARINKNVLIILFVLILFFLINLVFNSLYPELVINQFGKLVIYGISGLIVFSYKFDTKLLYSTWIKISFVFLILIHLLIPAIINRTYSYYDAGLTLNFVFIGFILGYFKNYNRLWIWGLMYVLIISVLLGNRGGIIVNIVLLIYFLFKANILKMNYIFIIAPLLGLFGYIFFSNFSILSLYNSIASKISFLNSYSIKKIIGDLESGTLNLSGRSLYYDKSFDIISENHFIWPSGFGTFQYETGLVFPHNILLELYITFGFFTIFIIAYIGKISFEINQKTFKQFQIIYFCIMIFSLVRLFTGGSFITETSFWAMIGLGLSRHKYFVSLKGECSELESIS